MTCHRICNRNKPTGVTSRAETVNPSEHKYTTGFYWGSCCSIFSFLYIVFNDISVKYRDGQFFWWIKPQFYQKFIDLPQVMNEKKTDCDYDEMNLTVDICDTDIP